MTIRVMAVVAVAVLSVLTSSRRLRLSHATNSFVQAANHLALMLMSAIRWLSRAVGCLVDSAYGLRLIVWVSLSLSSNSSEICAGAFGRTTRSSEHWPGLNVAG